MEILLSNQFSMCFAIFPVKCMGAFFSPYVSGTNTGYHSQILFFSNTKSHFHKASEKAYVKIINFLAEIDKSNTIQMYWISVQLTGPSIL